MGDGWNAHEMARPFDCFAPRAWLDLELGPQIAATSLILRHAEWTTDGLGETD